MIANNSSVEQELACTRLCYTNKHAKWVSSGGRTHREDGKKSKKSKKSHRINRQQAIEYLKRNANVRMKENVVPP